jgi:hypothetical protein
LYTYFLYLTQQSSATSATSTAVKTNINKTNEPTDESTGETYYNQMLSALTPGYSFIHPLTPTSSPSSSTIPHNNYNFPLHQPNHDTNGSMDDFIEYTIATFSLHKVTLPCNTLGRLIHLVSTASNTAKPTPPRTIQLLTCCMSLLGDHDKQAYSVSLLNTLNALKHPTATPLPPLSPYYTTLSLLATHLSSYTTANSTATNATNATKVTDIITLASLLITQSASSTETCYAVVLVDLFGIINTASCVSHADINTGSSISSSSSSTELTELRGRINSIVDELSDCGVSREARKCFSDLNDIVILLQSIQSNTDNGVIDLFKPFVSIKSHEYYQIVPLMYSYIKTILPPTNLLTNLPKLKYEVSLQLRKEEESYMNEFGDGLLEGCSVFYEAKGMVSITDDDNNGDNNDISYDNVNRERQFMGIVNSLINPDHDSITITLNFSNVITKTTQTFKQISAVTRNNLFNDNISVGPFETGEYNMTAILSYRGFTRQQNVGTVTVNDFDI